MFRREILSLVNLQMCNANKYLNYDELVIVHDRSHTRKQQA